MGMSFTSPAKVCEFSHSVILPNQMEKLESVQYSAALAVSGAWRGTSREKVYAELGWESLSLRRWSRRLTLFYKFINNLTPGYTKDPIPPLRQSQYSFRNQDVVGRIVTRTEKFQSSFYPDCLTEWNNLDPEIRLAPSVAVFKKKLLAIIRPPAKPVVGIHDPIGLSHLTQLRVGLSKLNLHKFQHNFRDTLDPMCPFRMMALRILNTSCCSAPRLICNEEIFSLEFRQYYDHSDIITFQIRS